MIRVDEKEHIRNLHLVQGKGIREIARITGRSRQAVRKALRSGTVPVYSPRGFVGRKLLSEHQERIQQWLAEDKQVRRKQRHTGTRIAKRLRDECDYEGGDATVRRYIAKSQGPSKLKAFIPLEFDPGKNAQCDWGDADVYLDGELVRVKIFELRLNHSKAIFVKAFRSEELEAFFQGHVDAFAFFGGAPVEIAYDNLKCAVNKVIYQKPDESDAPEGEQGRLLQTRFVGMRLHFGFESHFCQRGIRGGHEKGGVENGIGYARRNWLVPIPRVKDMEDLNRHLLDCCRQELERTPEGLDRPIGVMLEDEQEDLLPLPVGEFPCEQLKTVKVSPYCTVTYKTQRYSVPFEHAGKQVLLHAGADAIWVEAEGKEIARHTRLFGAKGQESLSLEHYLGLLRLRPGAIEHAKPIRRFLARQESETWRRVFERLGRKSGRSRDFIQLLEWRQELGDEAMLGALEFGLRQAGFPMELVEAEAWRHAAKRPAPPQGETDWMLSLEVPVGELSHFDQLSGWSGVTLEKGGDHAVA